jgi:serine/threonine protein kinase
LGKAVQSAVDGFVVARRYVLGRKLGSGGMGTVWLAHDSSLDRICALKIVDPDKASSDEVRKRFLREARATAQIRSAHVVEVFEHGVWEGLPFIVMELLDGEELGARLERLGMLEPEAAYRIVAQIARGLASAHALGIVHRDLKPENVFLVPRDGEELVKVLDFGIAHHVVYSPRDKATQAGAVMGTPCFMSPEQALGEATDWRADLWALAVLSFQCLTGKLPFFHDAIGGLLTQILYEPIPSILAANPALPKGLEDWWQHAVEREPARRFQTAAEMSDALARALGVEPIGVPALVPCSEALSMELGDTEDTLESAPEFVGRGGSDAPVALDNGHVVTSFRRKRQRASPWTWGIAAVGLCALVALGWFAGKGLLLEAARPASPSPLAAPAPHDPSVQAGESTPRPSVVPLSPVPNAAGVPAPPAGPGDPDAGIRELPLDPRTGMQTREPWSGSQRLWPSPRQPDMPSLENPASEPPARQRLPVRRRSGRPVSEPGTRDYGI